MAVATFVTTTSSINHNILGIFTIIEYSSYIMILILSAQDPSSSPQQSLEGFRSVFLYYGGLHIMYHEALFVVQVPAFLRL